jgi:antitoxin FitA
MRREGNRFSYLSGWQMIIHQRKCADTTFQHDGQDLVQSNSEIRAVYSCSMSKLIQRRNVPDALHRTLKARAAAAGISLSDYLLAEIKKIAERPTLAEFRARLHKRKPISVEIDSARIVREERGT